MRSLKLLFSAIAFAVLTADGAYAQMLAGTLQALSPSSPDVVSFMAPSSFAGFAVYAMPESPSLDEGVPYTDSTNVANFSDITGSFAGTDYGGAIELTFPYVIGGIPGVAQETTVMHYASAGNSLSLSSSLFAPSETFSFYLEDDSGPTSVLAFLSGTGTSGTPAYTASFSPLTGSYGYEIVTLNVTGAQTNNILTFSLQDPTTGHASIQGVAVTPEPATWTLLALGAALLVAARRRLSPIA